jgi:hypothetical protein
MLSIIFLVQANNFSFVDMNPWPLIFECATVLFIITSNDNGKPGVLFTDTLYPFFLHILSICLETLRAYAP